MSYHKKRRVRSESTLDAMEGQQDNTAAVTDAIFGSEGGKLQRSLQPRDNETLNYGPITLTKTGIIWPDKRPVTEELYEGLGREIFKLDGSLQWMIGDWLVYGDNHQWGETIDRLAKEYNREKSTIYVYKSVAANVLIRIKTLTFGHHQLVAPLPVEEQARWLNEADTNGWSIARLREAINKSSGRLPAPTEAQLRIKQHTKAIKKIERAIAAVQDGKKLPESKRKQIKLWLNGLKQYAESALEIIDNIE